MTKTFCDRCGKEIPEGYGWLAHRTLFLPRKERAEWTERDDLYICPECEDSFIRWLMNQETENGR